MDLEIKERFTQVEGSKSIINRALILISLQKNPITFHNFSSCNDVQTMVENFQKLGFEIEQSDGLTIYPPENIPSRFNLFVEDSATGLRFLLARLAAIPKRSFRISFSKQLQKRPLMPLLHVLYEMGAKLTLHQDSISIEGKQLQGGVYKIPGNVSSQFISALCLLAPLFTEDVELLITDTIVSKSYLHMTLAMLKKFGICSELQGNSVYIPANQVLNSIQEYHVEPDFSSLAYFWAYAVLMNKAITTKFVQNSMQSDSHFINILQKMGASIEMFPQKIVIQSNSVLHGIEQSMLDMPDQVPTLAVLALHADSPTKITEINHLQYKESNRLQAVAKELRKIGATILLTDDTMLIHPLQNEPLPVQLKTHNDHRLVMAFSILEQKYPQIELDDTDAVKKSNPLFFSELQKMS